MDEQEWRVQLNPSRRDQWEWPRCGQSEGTPLAIPPSRESGRVPLSEYMCSVCVNNLGVAWKEQVPNEQQPRYTRMVGMNVD